jgi:hypothetical protein
LIGAVTALESTQPWEGQALGSLAWLNDPDAEAAHLLVAGDANNSRLALYAIGGANVLQQLQVETRVHAVWVRRHCSGQRLMLHMSAEAVHVLDHKVLELHSSDDSGFFNHMLAEPTTGLVVLANAKRKALYAAHVAGMQRLTKAPNFHAMLPTTYPMCAVPARHTSPVCEQAAAARVQVLRTVAKRPLTISHSLPSLCHC